MCGVAGARRGCTGSGALAPKTMPALARPALFRWALLSPNSMPRRRHKGHQTRDFANVLLGFDSSKESSTESRWTPLEADYSKHCARGQNRCCRAMLRPPAARSDRNINKDGLFRDRSVPSEELLN